MGKSGFRSRRLVNAPAAASAPIAPLPEAITPPQSLESLAPVTLSWPARVGDRLARLGDWDAAARAYAAALASDPQEGRSAIALGEVELRRDRPEAALAAFEQVLAGDAHNLAALLGASRAQAQLGKGAAAAELALRAWILHPDRPEPARRLAALDRQADRPFDAADSWQGRLADRWLVALAEHLDCADRLLHLDSDPNRLFAAQVDGGHLWHWRGAIGMFDAENRLVLELSEGNLPQWLRVQPPLPTAALSLPGRVAVLASGAGDRLDRWLESVVPRLQTLLDCGESWDAFDALVFDRIDRPFQQATLDRFGIPRDRVVELDRYGVIQLETAIVPRRFNGPSGYGVQALRNRWGAMDGDRATQRWVLWPSATESVRWLNGNELLDHLAPWGFARLDPDALRFEQLLAALQTAEAIVGPAHPVLALLPCCPADCSLLELGSRRYEPLAQLVGTTLGTTYRSIPGEGRADGRSPHPSREELWVRSAEVRAVLARCLKRGLRISPDRPAGKRPKKMGVIHSHSPDFRDLRD